MSVGRAIRTQRLFHDGRACMVAVDQVVPRGLTVAPQDPVAAIALLGGPPRRCDGVLLHHGLVRRAATILAENGLPFLVKLSTATAESPDRLRRRLVTSVEQAAALGADGVGLNLYVGGVYEAEGLSQLAEVDAACERYGMPLMLMINPVPGLAHDADALAYVARVGAELGADIIKTDYAEETDRFRHVVAAANGLPVLVEESPLAADDAGTLATLDGVMAAGGAGLLLGGRLWSRPDPIALLERAHGITHREDLT
jgi:fructose-bisphosphate aldolase/2-amino-3,7-dideoxy-D-threo-hept-6-ulosonate synthase